MSDAQANEPLPSPREPSAFTAGLTLSDSHHQKRQELKHLKADAPNILIILIDDVDPGTPSTFGGEIHTPTLSRVSKSGISYNRFHSTAMCSPTRAALLTGRNHTRVGSGQIAEFANDWNGFSGGIPKSSATLAEVLKQYGYSTSTFGKWHNTPINEITLNGPFQHCPTNYSFEYFYGFLAGETSQYEPNTVRNTTYVTPNAPRLGSMDNHLTLDLELNASSKGVLYALGGYSGGLYLWVENGTLTYEFNYFNLQRTRITNKLLPPIGRVKLEVVTRFPGKDLLSDPVKSPFSLMVKKLAVGASLNTPLGCSRPTMLLMWGATVSLQSPKLTLSASPSSLMAKFTNCTSSTYRHLKLFVVNIISFLRIKCVAVIASAEASLAASDSF